jgi:Mlc titration factor MtfA (ptsG expression regulator)
LVISLLALVAVLAVAWFFREPLFGELWRRRIRREPFPAEWRQILRQRVPLLRAVPADLQLQLKKRIQVFLARKPFIGCAGLEVTEEMRVTIAAQACLLTLNRRGEPFPNLRQILVYPGAFLVERLHADGSGVLQDRRQALAGESWTLGQVVLSWEDTLEGAGTPDDGRNVVIHEFAHQLDQENGRANGAPPIAGKRRRQRWARVLGGEFEALRQAVSEGRPSLIGAYGASDPAEFFAVATEVFFEQPAELAAGHAELYRVLSEFYRVDPLSW